MIKALSLVFAVFLALAGLAACSAGSEFSNTAQAPAAPPEAKDEGSYSGGSGAPGFTADNSAEEPAPQEEGEADYGEIADADGANPVLSGQKLIYTVYYEIETLDFDKSLSDIEALVTKLGGYVEGSNVTGTSVVDEGYRRMRSASYTLRIPTQKLKDFETSAGDIGNILNNNTKIENVTEKYYDIEARLKSLQTQQERLLALLEKSGELKDVIELEKALSEVIYQIESLTGTKRGLDSLIDFSTININLQEVVKTSAVKDTPRTLGDEIGQAFSNSLDSVSSFGKGLLIFFVGGAPVILLWLIILGLAAFIAIRVYKKRKMRLEAAYRAASEREYPVNPSGDAPDPGEKNE